MNVLNRISNLIAANINHMLDKAEDPEVMIKQLIREMEESIIELRRETVRAIARQKQIEKEIQLSKDRAREFEEKARQALHNKDEELARNVVARKLSLDQKVDTLSSNLKTAVKFVAELKADLSKLEDQAQEARRKKEELIRRKRAAEARLRIQKNKGTASRALNAAVKSILEFSDSGKSMEDYEQAIRNLEAEAEAANELLKEQTKAEELEKISREDKIARELERLKKVQKK